MTIVLYFHCRRFWASCLPASHHFILNQSDFHCRALDEERLLLSSWFPFSLLRSQNTPPRTSPNTSRQYFPSPSQTITNPTFLEQVLTALGYRAILANLIIDDCNMYLKSDSFIFTTYTVMFIAFPNSQFLIKCLVYPFHDHAATMNFPGRR